MTEIYFRLKFFFQLNLENPGYSNKATNDSIKVINVNLQWDELNLVTESKK